MALIHEIFICKLSYLIQRNYLRKNGFALLVSWGQVKSKFTSQSLFIKTNSCSRDFFCNPLLWLDLSLRYTVNNITFPFQWHTVYSGIVFSPCAWNKVWLIAEYIHHIEQLLICVSIAWTFSLLLAKKWASFLIDNSHSVQRKPP